MLDFNKSWREQKGPLETPCHVWTRGKFESGYGAVRMNGKLLKAHRVSYMRRYRVSLTSAQLVLHHCDVRACINADHLYVGTHGSNLRDAHRRGRWRQEGERNFQSRLTARHVRLMRKARRRGQTLSSLALEFRVSFQNVSKICRRQRWQHVK